MKINVAKIKKVFAIILTIIVCFLVIIAIYSNKSRFFSSETVKYSRITLDEKTNISEIIEQYSGNKNKEKFISELKKVNNITNLSDKEVYGLTIYVPLASN